MGTATNILELGLCVLVIGLHLRHLAELLAGRYHLLK